jgi:DNA-binding PadR family transcriptional regulator
MRPNPDPGDHIPLSPPAFQILLSLLEGARHPYSILKAIQDRTGGEMVLGTSTVYSAIKRMVREGLLQEVSGPEVEVSRGPSRRYYALTEFGLAVTRAEGARISRLHRMIRETALLQGAEGAVSREAGS